MRLGQLARKLSVRPAEITAFLAGQNIQLDEGSNVRLDESQVALVIRHFDAANADFLMTSHADPEETAATPPAEESTENTGPAVVQEATNEPNMLLETPGEEKPEVIRAPKVELTGLKVLGKIELPETKKKEVVTEPTEEAQPVINQASEEAKRPPRKPFRQNDRRQQPGKNPVAAQREREAWEAEKRKKEDIKREKEKRTQHYKSKTKSVPIKAVRKVEEPLEEFQEIDKGEPLSRWKRFLRWWNT